MNSKSKRLKFTAIFFLLIFLQSTFLPSIAFALTSGPHQPEYSGYESMGTTDMANLITGDFTYNMPILEVPSPEGGFALPLSYHAGISPEEEASWVGLGWSLNAGAIDRNVVQYPDDFNGQLLSTNMQNSGGYKYSINFLLGSHTYDSEKGSGGTIGFGQLISGGWGNQNGFTAIGVTFSDRYEGGVHVDPVGVATSLATIVSFGIASAGGATIGQAACQALGFSPEGLFSRYVGMGLAARRESRTSGNQAVNVSDWTQELHNYFFKQTYKYYLDATKNENMYGALYLNEALSQTYRTTQDVGAKDPLVHLEYLGIGPQNADAFLDKKYSNNPNTQYPVSDMHVYSSSSDFNQLAYNIEPSSIGYDNFNVMGAGVSGNIKPYLHEVASLAFPALGNYLYRRYALLKASIPAKTHFRYEGDIANSYLYTQETPGYGLGITYDFGSPGNSGLKWTVTEPHLLNGTSGLDRRESNREGLHDNHLSGSRFVNWFSNDEIKTGTATANGFIDFLPETERNTFRTNLQAEDGIGGFAITRSDGLTYHYSIPIYNFNQTIGYASSDGKSWSSSSMSAKYAYTWLLIGITGPDFIDRSSTGNANGILDNSDWGYWVKFDYGKFTSDYVWRDPYFGSTNNTAMSGKKECYYLNSISTRTHTALFIKDVRTDNKGYYKKFPSEHPLFSSNFKPASSMKLNEIVLLKNEDFATLTDQSGEYRLKYDSGNNNTMLASMASFDGSASNKILDRYDFPYSMDQSSQMLTFIRENQLKSIVFNYYAPGEYGELCQGALNSFESNIVPPDNVQLKYDDKKGKLTLKSISLKGRNNIKLMPDYSFEYGNNPVYNKDNSDGWGMYTANGAGSKAATSDGKDWSLTKIRTPTGAEIKVEYERDRYSSISGNAVQEGVYDNASNSITFPAGSPDDFSSLSPGTEIVLQGVISKGHGNKCRSCTAPDCGWDDNYKYTYTDFSSITTVKSVSGKTIYLNTNLVTHFRLYHNASEPCLSRLIERVGIHKINSRYGGDIRVARIGVKNEDGNESITEYIYTKDGSKTGFSSGVCSVEPEPVRKTSFSFYNLFDYPVTPVLYGKVTVFEKSSAFPKDHILKTEYNFTTPNQNMITQTTSSTYESGNSNFSFSTGASNNRLKMYRLNLNVNTSAIGSLLSVKKYNSRNTLLSTVQYNYGTPSNSPDMGKYSEGSLVAERIVYLNEANYYKVIRTTKIYNPTIPKSVSITDDAGTITTTNTAYDYYTGNVLETMYENSNGEKYKTTSVPAYKKYTAMDSKIYNSNNKNMLTQEAANYLYWIKPDNSETKLVSENVQTWSKEWKYWDYNASSGGYEDVTEATDAKKVWRKQSSYVWKSPVNADGTINTTSYADFNWNNPESSVAGWQKTGEVTRYDHYSHPLEGKDVNNHFASSKMGHNASFGIASSGNSNYRSFTSTGFEDLVNVNPSGTAYYFGGEVALNQGTQISSDNGGTILPHTGKYMVKITGGQDGPIYRVNSEFTNGIQTGRTYRASVWMHNSSPDATTLVCSLTGTNTGSNNYVTATKTSGKHVDNWWLVSVDIAVPANYSGTGTNNLKVYVMNAGSGYAYIDDMRMHPLDSPVISNVYDEKTGLLTATLDNENFATLFEYDDAGRIIRTKKETLNGIFKVSETDYNFGRQ